MKRIGVLLAAISLGTAIAAPAPQETASPTASAGTPASTVCGDIVNSKGTT